MSQLQLRERRQVRESNRRSRAGPARHSPGGRPGSRRSVRRKSDISRSPSHSSGKNGVHVAGRDPGRLETIAESQAYGHRGPAYRPHCDCSQSRRAISSTGSLSGRPCVASRCFSVRTVSMGSPERFRASGDDRGLHHAKPAKLSIRHDRDVISSLPSSSAGALTKVFICITFFSENSSPGMMALFLTRDL